MASPSHTQEWPKVTSIYHSERYCGPCILCKKMQPRYNHFGALSDNEQKFIQVHYYGSDISRGSCICRAHVAEAKRHCSDPLYIHVWKNNGSDTVVNTGKICQVQSYA